MISPTPCELVVQGTRRSHPDIGHRPDPRRLVAPPTRRPARSARPPHAWLGPIRVTRGAGSDGTRSSPSRRQDRPAAASATVVLTLPSSYCPGFVRARHYGASLPSRREPTETNDGGDSSSTDATGGSAANLVNTLFIGLVAALALAFGLAFGLGGRDVAAQLTERWYEQSQDAAARVRAHTEERAVEETATRRDKLLLDYTGTLLDPSGRAGGANASSGLRLVQWSARLSTAASEPPAASSGGTSDLPMAGIDSPHRLGSPRQEPVRSTVRRRVRETSSSYRTAGPRSRASLRVRAARTGGPGTTLRPAR